MQLVHELYDMILLVIGARWILRGLSLPRGC